MTTAMHYPRRYARIQRKEERRGSFLLSPLALLILVGLLFIFFLTASNEPAYLRHSGQQQNESTPTAAKPDPVVLYKKVVTGADAIRSVLQ